MFQNGWHYYVVVYLTGNAPRKVRTGTSRMGIDPGTSTMACVSDTSVILTELAPGAKEYDRKIYKVQQSLDRSRRAMNPNRFNEDGTIRKGGREKWICSGTYKKNRRLLKTLYRKKAAYVKQSHEELCNRLLADSDTFLVEKMTYSGLQRRAKETRRQDTPTTIRQNDGTVRSVYKCKRKKRFGRSLNNRAPSLFLTILEQKCGQYGLTYREVDTKTFQASRYNHVTDTCEAIPLSQRQKQIGGHVVQRDLYSAFLIKNADRKLKHPDREQCIYEFERFVTMQNNTIAGMKTSGISMKQCFGF